MRFIFSTFAFLVGVSSFAQIGHSLEVYSEDSEKFTLYINNEQINAQPESRVTVDNIHHDQVEARVVFTNPEAEPISKRFFQIGEVNANPSRPQSTVYKIVKTKRGYKLRLAQMSPKKIQEDRVIIIGR